MKFEFHVLFKSTSTSKSLDSQAAAVREASLETASEYPQISEIYVESDNDRSGVAVGLRLNVGMPDYADETAKDFLDDVIAVLNSHDASSREPEFVTARQALVAV